MSELLVGLLWHMPSPTLAPVVCHTAGWTLLLPVTDGHRQIGSGASGVDLACAHTSIKALSVIKVTPPSNAAFSKR